MGCLFGCTSLVFFLLMEVTALLLVIDIFTGQASALPASLKLQRGEPKQGYSLRRQDGGVHLVFLLLFGVLFLFSWGLSKLFWCQ